MGLDLSLGDLIKAENKKKKKTRRSNLQKKKKQPQKKKSKKKKKPEQMKKLAKPGFIKHVAALHARMQEVAKKPKGVYEDPQQKAKRMKRTAKARKSYLEAKAISNAVSNAIVFYQGYSGHCLLTKLVSIDLHFKT